jgi:hypothetical protein
MNYVDKLIDSLRALEDSGSIVQSNGTRLISKFPPRKDGLFSDAYLHEIYVGLKESEIDDLEALVCQKLPEQLREFYGYANGLSIFADSLSIRGLRRNYTRDIGSRLPVSLEYGNTVEKPKGDSRSQLRFGWYSEQGAELVINLDNPEEVCAVPRYESSPVLYRWSSIEELLATEVERMGKIYLMQPDKVDFFNPISMPTNE